MANYRCAHGARRGSSSAGLVIYASGSFEVVLALSVGFSALGVVVISLLDSTSHVLIPDWESDLDVEAQLKPVAATAGADD